MANKIYSITSLFIILLVHFLSLVNCQLPSAPALYVFGDSLVDCGNNDKLLTLARANYPPYGANFIDGATGRFTNNETLADIIAQFLGLPLPPAFKSLDLATFNKLTGVNYASGGVGILPETGRHFGGGITFDQQIDYFQKTVESLQPQFPSPVDLQKYLAKSIVLVSIGTNDYISNYQLPLFYKTSKSYSPQTYPPVLVEKLSQQLQRLYNLGARKFVVFEIGPVGCMPYSIQRHRTNTQCVEEYNQLVSYFNPQLTATLNRLTSLLPGSTFINGKIHNFFKTMVQNPSTYGFKEIRDTCCSSGDGSKTCTALLPPCKNPSEHLWWDGFHPTTATYSILARDCYSGSSTCFPINIDQLAKV
ncbi:hypothetical protein AQUCO_00200956v1 [Aquilegia coerulea]|uniref:SGNH hydrolase-type esterase domain-containing protein n=1 Tax=Aquilegia coerulea TaxID=218851 RepID=A0A2G5F5X3_AQUCA|nr:hypothetical protein AQUCO_00200956v1 [Aquilegia coerulea]